MPGLLGSSVASPVTRQSPQLSRPEPSVTRRQVRQRRFRVALIAALGVLAIVAALVGRDSGGGSNEPVRRTPPPRATVQPVRLTARVVAQLSAPVEGAAVAQAGLARTVLLGGLTPADSSRADVVILRGSRETGHSLLPAPLHDAAAVGIGHSVYLFGGGDVSGSIDRILRVSLHGKPAQQVGTLPRPLSDIAAAAVGNTAYIVGGYDGTKSSDAILAWRPGQKPKVVGRLVHPLRYAAVTALGGTLYIAGGTTPTGESHGIFSFDTRTRALKLVARLPRSVTHAAAAAFGCCVYVIGGRASQTSTVPSRRIFALEPGKARVRPAGRLPVPLSDLVAVSQRRRILTFGGRSPTQTVASVIELRPPR